jgi:hypothetical protein
MAARWCFALGLVDPLPAAACGVETASSMSITDDGARHKRHAPDSLGKEGAGVRSRQSLQPCACGELPTISWISLAHCHAPVKLVVGLPLA